jgi:hypothetical protein
MPPGQRGALNISFTSRLHGPARGRFNVILKVPLIQRVLKALADADVYFRMRHPKGRTQIEGVGEQDAEADNTWTEVTGTDRRAHKVSK